MQRGRKSAEALGLAVIDIQAQRLKLAVILEGGGRAVFEHVVGHCAPMHFKASDLPLFAQYSHGNCPDPLLQ